MKAWCHKNTIFRILAFEQEVFDDFFKRFARLFKLTPTNEDQEITPSCENDTIVFTTEKGQVFNAGV